MAHTPKDERSFADLMAISFFSGAGYKAYDKVSDIDLRRWKEFSGSEAFHEVSQRFAAAPELLTLAIQYRDDMRRTPSEESRQRRLEAINAAIAKAEGRS